MEIEFNLSEKEVGNPKALDEHVYKSKDVKEFIKLLKEEIENEEFTYTDDLDRLFPIIDKLAGKELTG